MQSRKTWEARAHATAVKNAHRAGKMGVQPSYPPQAQGLRLLDHLQMHPALQAKLQ